MRLIDADALKAHYAWWGDYPEEAPEQAEEKKIFDTIVDLQPTVDPAVERRGKWKMTDDNGTPMLRCSSCRCRVKYEQYRAAVGDKGFSYCPYCGVRLGR